MAQAITQQSWSDEQFVEGLVSLCGSDEMSHLLHSCREQISQSVIRLLKDKVGYLIRADVHRAVDLAEAMREAAEWMADPICEALANHAYAQALHVSGRYAEAIQFYQYAEDAYARLGREVETAQITKTKIAALMCLGQYGEAFRLEAKAREVLRRYEEPILLAQLELNIGNVYHRLDQYWEALRCYERAGEIFAAHQDEMGLALTSFNCANQYACLNDFERALTLYQQAGQVYEKLGMSLELNNVEYSIAWLYFQRGKFQDSLKLFVKVTDRARELGDVTLEALCDLDLAEVYLRLNAYEDAIESAQLAVEKFGALGMTYEHIKAKMYLGIAYTHLKDLAAAERELQEARRGFIAEGNGVFTAFANIYLSEVFMQQRAWHQAQQLCIEAREIFNRQGLSAKAPYAELQLARLKMLLGEVEEAQRLCQSSLAAIEELEAPWLRHQGLHLLGNTLEQAGKVAEAYRCYTQAVEHLESLRSTIRVDEFKCTFLKDKLRVYEDLVDLCLRAETREKVEEALSYAEAAKSRALVDLLSSNQQQIESKVSGAAADAIHREWRELREQLDWYYNRINHYELRSHQPPDWLGSQLREEVYKRERNLAKLDRRMRIEDAEYTSLQTASRPDISDLRRYLAEDEILVEYYVVNGRIKAFLLSPDGVHVVNDLSTVGATTPLLRKLRFYFDKFTLSGGYVSTHQENIQKLTDQCLKMLYAGLVDPVTPWLEGKKVIFVPHDVLHYVPFHALHDGREYLIDQYEISYSPSASVFKWCADKARKQRVGEQALIMGVPDDAMPFIHNEVAAVKSLWPDARVLLGAEATLDQLKQNAPACRLLHLASHGVFRRDNPMFSALRLSDSWLSFYDIFNLDLNAELVTLSACETGMNEVFPGDELFGLMRG
ncbi:MAG: CHAT domain-containing protein, partial [Acidobacteria bacterium]|nr:CHAT domain-containing protein [Acidobacteriota bacterium]